MQAITITVNERIISSGNGTENAVQFQIRQNGHWNTVHRKSYSGSWKGNVIDDITREYRRQIK